MKLMTNLRRPSALPAVWAPPSMVRPKLPVVGQESVLALPTVTGMPCAGVPSSRVHQVQIQVEQARAAQAQPALILARTAEGYGTTSGFTVKGTPMGKQLIDGARGVPPRGRPV